MFPPQLGAGRSATIETSEPRLIGSRGQEILQVPTGQNSAILTQVISGLDLPVQVIAIIEVRGSSNISHVIQFRELTIGANAVVNVTVSWTPSDEDQYKLRTFIISGWENPQVMSIVRSTEITVTESTPPSPCKGTTSCVIGKVAKIVDGDTIDVSGTRIRLALVNTPEIGEPGYTESKQFTSELCPVGSEAVVDQDDGQPEGSFGRMIAMVTCGDKVLNEELLDMGFGNILQQFCGISEFGDDDWAKKHGC